MRPTKVSCNRPDNSDATNMHGPKPSGTWTGREPAKAWGSLQPGRSYEVRERFVDYDGVEHPVGESWLFLGSNFLPYDDGLSLFVSLDGRDEWHIRLQDRPTEQASVVRRLADHVVLIDTSQHVIAGALPNEREWHLSLRLRGWRWVAVYAGFGFVAGAAGGAVIAAVALPDSRVEGAAALALWAGASMLLIGLVFGCIGLVLGWRTRRRVQWEMLATALSPGTSAQAVFAFLGEPNGGRIEFFPVSASADAAATTWVYRPAVHDALRYRGRLAVDFDVRERVVALRRV